MCTAIRFRAESHYFGRNLDLEYSYEESVLITPRNYEFRFRKMPCRKATYAMIGIGIITDGYPLYFDAVNEHGLGIAGLNFPGNAVYHPIDPNKDNIAPYELTPWLLSQCTTVCEAERLLNRSNLLDIPFSSEFPLSPLHWIICDKERCIVVEPLKDGLMIHENPVDVLTNNPPFDYHMHNLKNYMALSCKEPVSSLLPGIKLKSYSRGMGAMGLPGDLSSASRFVRAAFTLHNSFCDTDEASAVGQFFHILSSVEQTQGSVLVGEQYEKTIYSSCCNTDKSVYYYTTYSNRQITAVKLHDHALDSSQLTAYPLITQQQVYTVSPKFKIF